jgi:hypothetical protein
MPTKVDPNSANLAQLYDLHRRMDQCMVSAEGKYTIPTRDIMSRNPIGQLTISDWRTSDFLYTAEAMEQAFGFSEGTLPHQRYYCQYREGEFPVFIDIYGRVMEIESCNARPPFSGEAVQEVQQNSSIIYSAKYGDCARY